MFESCFLGQDTLPHETHFPTESQDFHEKKSFMGWEAWPGGILPCKGKASQLPVYQAHIPLSSSPQGQTGDFSFPIRWSLSAGSVGSQASPQNPCGQEPLIPFAMGSASQA